MIDRRKFGISAIIGALFSLAFIVWGTGKVFNFGKIKVSEQSGYDSQRRVAEYVIIGAYHPWPIFWEKTGFRYALICEQAAGDKSLECAEGVVDEQSGMKIITDAGIVQPDRSKLNGHTTEEAKKTLKQIREMVFKERSKNLPKQTNRIDL